MFVLFTVTLLQSVFRSLESFISYLKAAAGQRDAGTQWLWAGNAKNEEMHTIYIYIYMHDYFQALAFGANLNDAAATLPDVWQLHSNVVKLLKV